MNADDGFDVSKVEEELEDYADTLESLHDPKKRNEMLSRKNNTFLGDGPDLPAGCSGGKGVEGCRLKAFISSKNVTLSVT